MAQENKKIKKWTGVVVSAKMNKTIVVRVDRVMTHPQYGKKMTSSKRFKVHCTNPDIKEGDKVSFVECRPLSRDKRWRLASKIS